MTELSDYRRMVEAPMLAAKDAEIARLRLALAEVVDPLKFMRERAEANGDHLSGMAYSIANNLHYVKEIARKALEDQPA